MKVTDEEGRRMHGRTLFLGGKEGREGAFEEERAETDQSIEKELGGEKTTTGRAPALHYKPAFIYIR